MQRPFFLASSVWLLAATSYAKYTDVSKLCETTDFCDPPEGYVTMEFPTKAKRGQFRDNETGALLVEIEYGVPQEVTGKYENDTQAVIDKSDKYMLQSVYKDVKYEGVRADCLNTHKWCSFWAATGECQSNRNFMMQTCAPACRSCLYHSYEHRCGSQSFDQNENVLKSGDITKLMERIVVSYNGTQLWSRPYPDEQLPSPWLVTIDDFLNGEECDTLIRLGHAQGFERSMEGGIMGTDGRNKPRETVHRTSSTAWCHDHCQEHAITQRLLARLQGMTDIPISNYELIQLLQYQKGQKYALHSDYVEDFSDRHPGPRVLTAYLYLNDDFVGGETKFDMLDVTVQPKKGRLVLWPSVQDKRPFRKERQTHHQALAVKQGTKYGANVWIHARDFQTPFERGCV